MAAAGLGTKDSGTSAGTGASKEAMVAQAKVTLDKINAENRLIGQIIVEMFAGKDYVLPVGINPKLFLYLGYNASNIEPFFTSHTNDTNKIWTSSGSTATNPAGIARRPRAGRKIKGTRRTVGRQVAIILPKPYPKAEIGGDTGNKGNNSTDSSAARKASEIITLNIPNTIPLLSVGLMLYDLNKNSTVTDRKIVEYKTITSTRTKLVPADDTQAQEDMNKLATIAEK